MKFSIILKDGTIVNLPEWQELYNIPRDQIHIGKHFVIGEPKIKDGGTIAGILIVLLDRYREAKGVSVNINSFDRTQEKQEELIKDGYRAATTSPHVVKMAADPDTVSKADTIASVALLKKIAKELNIKIRIGYKSYMADGSTFFHVDVCPEFYAPGKPYHNQPHPIQWEVPMTW